MPKCAYICSELYDLRKCRAIVQRLWIFIDGKAWEGTGVEANKSDDNRMRQVLRMRGACTNARCSLFISMVSILRLCLFHNVQVIHSVFSWKFKKFFFIVYCLLIQEQDTHMWMSHVFYFMLFVVDGIGIFHNEMSMNNALRLQFAIVTNHMVQKCFHWLTYGG